MINCMIVEDEQHSIDLLERYIERTPGLSLLAYDKNPLNAFADISTKQLEPDVVFLDINMPGLTGLDLAKQIISFTKVVFTSAHSKYGVKAFDIGAFDFLEKPFTYERFLQTIRRLNEPIVKHHQESAINDFFFIKGNKKGIVERVDLDNILYIESSHNYAVLYLSDGSKQTIYMSLAEIEGALPKDKFLRIQRSYIVNLKKIQKIEGNMIYLQSLKEPINCGSLYKESLLEVIKKQLLG
ncbi:hypothetical protein A9P82_13010 [Arachidicoccus ginsenosidimutans]|uniref:LytR/AlgR family response regulator transcription factor n=1 Tax=Arachidicoccus sp. BS20 TaxID=1850526 RepID=UPI0007F0C731|nr:LytTR family DNA-binding domain-containing protein [Arachidicoccus sp. BS20]ANI90122.1 hypothetical protein A9P82_13010 [Arachidicoccus sp. BS20]